jgi:hypothetical protein
MKIKPIDINNVSYANYREWLTSLAEIKKRLEDRQNKRLQVSQTIRKQREILKTLYKEENKLVQEIETFKENLIEVIPNKF